MSIPPFSCRTVSGPFLISRTSSRAGPSVATTRTTPPSSRTLTRSTSPSRASFVGSPTFHSAIATSRAHHAEIYRVSRTHATSRVLRVRVTYATLVGVLPAHQADSPHGRPKDGHDASVSRYTCFGER